MHGSREDALVAMIKTDNPIAFVTFTRHREGTDE